MKKLITLRIFTIGIALILAGPNLFASSKTDAAELAAVTKRITENLKRVRPGLPAPMVTRSAMEGFFEAGLPGGQVLYFHSDGKRFFAGDLVSIQDNDFVNLTATSRNSGRKLAVDAVAESDMVVFSPPRDLVKATITVFTDIDCGYCRLLHKEVPELNRLGIAVRYMAYPRSGLEQDAYKVLVSAWCSDDQKVAFTRAKMGEEIEPKTCDNPVAEQYKLGGQIGVNATPAIVFADGELHLGYMKAPELAEKLGIL